LADERAKSEKKHNLLDGGSKPSIGLEYHAKEKNNIIWGSGNVYVNIK